MEHILNLHPIHRLLAALFCVAPEQRRRALVQCDDGCGCDHGLPEVLIQPHSESTQVQEAQVSTA